MLRTAQNFTFVFSSDQFHHSRWNEVHNKDFLSNDVSRILSQFERWYTAPKLARLVLRFPAWLAAPKQCNSLCLEIGLVDLSSPSPVVDPGVLSSSEILKEKNVSTSLRTLETIENRNNIAKIFIRDKFARCITVCLDCVASKLHNSPTFHCGSS